MSRAGNNGRVTTQIGPWGMMPAWVLAVVDDKGKGLSGAELRVYCALRTFADQAGNAFPFVETVAERARVEPRTVERAIARLRDLNVLTTTRRYRDDGSIAGCDYHLRDTPPDEMVGVVPTSSSGSSRRDGRSKNTPGEHTKRTHQDLTETAARSARSGRTRDEDSAHQRTAAEVIAEDRRRDRELFRSMVGDRLYSTGKKNRWKEGVFTADQFYDAFRGRRDRPKTMPGAYVAALHNVDDWLLDQGLGRVA